MSSTTFVDSISKELCSLFRTRAEIFVSCQKNIQLMFRLTEPSGCSSSSLSPARDLCLQTQSPITHNKAIKNHRSRWTREEGRMSVFERKTETKRRRDKGRTRQRSKASLTEGPAIQCCPSAACECVMNTPGRARGHAEEAVLEQLLLNTLFITVTSLHCLQALKPCSSTKTHTFNFPLCCFID